MPAESELTELIDKMKKSLRVILTLLVILTPFVVLSQVTGGVGGVPPCGGPFAPPTCPIDGGVGFLIAAGLAFGGKKAHDLTKKR